MKPTLTLPLCLVALAGPALAQEFVPETVGVMAHIPEGPNLFVLDQAWAGPSKVNVLGADDFAVKGNMGTRTVAQMLLAPGGATLYTASVYMERYTYGKSTVVVQEFDVPTLSVKREFEVNPKFAQVESQPALMSFAGDGAYILLQNATPATSVSVIDIAAGKEVAEVPTPGCWGAFPAMGKLAFTTVCGDGTLTTYTFAADGSYGDPVKSDKIFDVDDDAVFTNAARMGEQLVFVTFKGNLLFVDIAGEKPVLSETVSLVDGVLGSWAPSGSELIAYNAPTNTAFILMHSGAYEGSHKNPAEEIWAVNMETKTVVGRSAAHHENGLVVTQTETPVLYGANEEGAVIRYEVTMGEEVTLAEAGEAEPGSWLPIMAADR